VYGLRRTRRAIFAVLPKTMKRLEGSYVETPDIHEVHSTWIKIHVDTPTPAHVDGEIFSEAIQDLEYRIYPQRLQILMP
jgi:diacylglycerol kinase family enzyme